jgi:hypothetical protein
MNQSEIDNNLTQWLAEAAYGIYADLEYALSEELETSDEPSIHLTDAVEKWANRLHANGVLTVDDFDTAVSMVARSRKMIEGDYS